MTPADPLVLVVEDDSSVRKALSRLIRSLGLDAATFASAEELLACDDLDAGACLLLDVQMEPVSGPALLQHLSSTGRRIPVVFISGADDSEAQAAAAAAGAAGFLHKPFSDEALLQAIHEAVRGDCPATG